MIGYLLLAHALYSSYEYNQLPITYSKSDLVLEVGISLLLIFLQSVYSIKPKGRLSVDNKIYKPEYLSSILIRDSLHELDQSGIHEYTKFESRVEFIDILQKRKQYNEYKKQI